MIFLRTMTFEIFQKSNYPIAAKIKSPGPCYIIPTSFGFGGHILTKTRQPAWTMRKQLKAKDYTFSPGPAAHDYIPHMYTVGKEEGPSWVMGSLLSKIRKFNTPGPAEYTVLSDSTCLGSPAWSMALPGLVHKLNTFPAPNAYQIPPITGAKHPCFGTPAHFTMRPKLLIGGLLEDHTKSPGPAGYSTVPLEHIKSRPSAWTIRMKLDPQKSNNTPGPAEYFPGLSHKERSSAFTMRIKHSEYEAPVTVIEPEFLLDWDC